MSGLADKPITAVYRSAAMSLRKANLARESGDTDEEVFQLNAFVTAVTSGVRAHPMYERRKTDKDCVDLENKLIDAVTRLSDIESDEEKKAEEREVKAAARRLEQETARTPREEESDDA